MCLSGVDYFSTLGYQPGIAILAAGALAPVATVVLVLVTLFGAVPVYRKVAGHSPHGLGSIALMERLVSGWAGKLLVLLLLGFAMTDFMITITLSSADAATHILHSTESPLLIPVTLGLILALAAVFFRGFREAVGVAVVLVAAYLSLSAVVIGVGLRQLVTGPGHVTDWWHGLLAQQSNPWLLLALAVIVFPKLALGLSGFETGVSVMPLIRATDLATRIRDARRLLLTSALIMCTFLITSSVVVAMLIPAAEFGPGGTADGRALAWLAHEYLGQWFGTVYDWVTVGILWFAGASAMAGLLALLPRYLPRFGMAPEWARRSRPMVTVLTVIAVLITLAFGASVDAQSGAYATGVLVVLVSGAVGVTLLSHGRERILAAVTTAVLSATLAANIIERPDGVRVAAFFIIGVTATSIISRAWRSFELRDVGVIFDPAAEHILAAHTTGTRLALVPAAPGGDLALKSRRIRQSNHLQDESLLILEIEVADPSVFAEKLRVRGTSHDELSVLNVSAASVPNAVAVIALEIRDLTGVTPDIYFEWAPGNPLRDMLRFLALGRGQNATVTREILRRHIPEERDRPTIHVS
ncbi:amino acid transporter [Corynebacterium sp. YIM 101645]|uniref:Amino acid transporter n=1 Tax=Corynebacterium lemuris TaxID=1859292 RepID=A0ABT2FTK1_9CORY|nr:amino acid transporter [Corynebacterium lemuris]MCS5478544.1 amino acid transporter [Corynebacterium lemuris]